MITVTVSKEYSVDSVQGQASFLDPAFQAPRPKASID